jgi:hypothetical protein
MASVSHPSELGWGTQVLRADVAQLVEHSLGKGEVTGSSPVISSRVGVFSSQLPVSS